MDLIHAWVVPPEASASASVYIVIAVLALLISGVGKGGFGGGVGILSVPLMLQVASYKFVLGMWLPTLVVCDLATIRHYPRQWNPRAFYLVSPGVLTGIVLTSLFLWHTNLDVATPQGKHFQAYLCLAVAAISVLFVALQLRPRNGAAGAWQPTWTGSLPLGLAAGVTTTISHAAGPLVNMYLLRQQMDQRTFVGTCGRFYFTFNSLKILSFLAAGLVTAHTLKYGLWLLVLSPATVWLGAWMNGKVNAAWFVRLIYFFLLAAALKLTYDGLSALYR